MLLSTFELLLKNITPNEGNIPDSNRKILQGYFLTISNPTNVSLNLRLQFNAITPDLDRSQLIVFSDTLGSNDDSNLTVNNTYDFALGAKDTGLVILQPNILTLNPDVDTVEFRGYVEVFIRQAFPSFPSSSARQLLFTPEHRGTFLPNSVSTEFDQLSTLVPTSTGAALMDVDVIVDPPFIFPPLLPQPSFPPITPVSNGISGDDFARLQQVMETMAQRIDELESSR